MILEKFENEIIQDDIKKFYTDLTDVFICKEYTYRDKKIGRYQLNENIINDIEKDIDYDFLLLTSEGHSLQDEIVLKYHKNIILNKIKDIFLEYGNQDIYIDEKIEYTDGIYILNWEDIKLRLNEKLKEEKDFRKSSIRISLASILASSHIFGIRKVEEFLKFKKNIICDENLVPITIYLNFFSKYNISSIFKIKDENKIVFTNNSKKDDDILKEVSEKDKEDFLGQKSDENIFEAVKKIKENDILKEIIKYIDNYYKKQNNNKSKITEKKENDEIKENSEFKEEKDIEKKYVKRNEKLDERIKEKYEKGEYSKKPSKYLKDVTNREVDEENLSDIDEILDNYEENSKKSKKTILGDFLSQKNFDLYRDLNYKNKKIDLEEVIYNLLVSNDENILDKIEKSLGSYSCKYIKESFTKKGYSLLKNIFLSKVSNLINANLSFNKIKLKVDLTEYNYLNYGKKDIDDIKVKGNKKILDILILKKLVKESYRLDSKLVRVYPRFRRLLDNILEEYIKKRIKLKLKNFD